MFGGRNTERTTLNDTVIIELGKQLLSHTHITIAIHIIAVYSNNVWTAGTIIQHHDDRRVNQYLALLSTRMRQGMM